MTEEQKERKRLYNVEYRNKNAEKIKAKNKKYVEENKEKFKDYYETNKEKIKEQVKQYREENKEQIKEREKERLKRYYQQNKEKIKERVKEYQSKTVDKKNERLKYRRDNDPIFKVKNNIRKSVARGLKQINENKQSKTELILGCSFAEFKTYLENQFESWMTWDNYGNPKDGIFEPNKTWDIDHKIPQSKGMTYDEVIKLNHYTNLQPLCSHFNRFVKRSTEQE
jgi:hypothetical protein